MDVYIQTICLTPDCSWAQRVYMGCHSDSAFWSAWFVDPQEVKEHFNQLIWRCTLSFKFRDLSTPERCQAGSGEDGWAAQMGSRSTKGFDLYSQYCCTVQIVRICIFLRFYASMHLCIYAYMYVRMYVPIDSIVTCSIVQQIHNEMVDWSRFFILVSGSNASLLPWLGICWQRIWLLGDHSWREIQWTVSMWGTERILMFSWCLSWQICPYDKYWWISWTFSCFRN